jgi:hypothetical protein
VSVDISQLHAIEAQCVLIGLVLLATSAKVVGRAGATNLGSAERTALRASALAKGGVVTSLELAFAIVKRVFRTRE